MSDPPLVHVIVLNYNGRSHLEYCLPSLTESAYENYELVVVDNDSSDDSVEYVRNNFPSVTVFEQDENKGWAGGNNAGVRYAMDNDADYIVLANNDIRVHPMWLTAAVEAAESDSSVGFVGFDVYGAFRPVPLETYEQASESWSEVSHRYTDDHIQGMALFVRRELFENVGTIDEGFFLYAEEIDLQIRGEKAGYLRKKTNVPVWHYSSGTTQDIPIKSSYFAIRNQIRLAIKHESVLGIMYKILLLYRKGCSPFFDGDMGNRINQRRRPRGIVFNFFFITFCFLWNIAHLPNTVRAKKRDYNRIDNYTDPATER